MKFEVLKAKVYEVADTLGRRVAVNLIRVTGGRESLAAIPEHLYLDVYREAERLLREHPNYAPNTSRLLRAAAVLNSSFGALDKSMRTIMSAMDDLKTAVDGAVGEMGKAADFIRNHPAAQSDPALQDMATRLKAASDALAGVDVEAVSTTSGSSTTGDSVTGGGDSVSGA